MKRNLRKGEERVKEEKVQYLFFFATFFVSHMLLGKEKAQGKREKGKERKGRKGE